MREELNRPWEEYLALFVFVVASLFILALPGCFLINSHYAKKCHLHGARVLIKNTSIEGNVISSAPNPLGHSHVVQYENKFGDLKRLDLTDDQLEISDD